MCVWWKRRQEKNLEGVIYSNDYPEANRLSHPITDNTAESKTFLFYSGI